MPELIAQGPEPSQRWRRALRNGLPVVLGRECGPWSVPWDDHISRQHLQMQWLGEHLRVERLPTARNPIFKGGQEVATFEMAPGEHFVVGQTSFTLLHDHVTDEQDSPRAVEEQTYSAQYLRGLRFHNADHRIEVLTRLPELISGATNDEELFTRLVNMLLSGMPRANAVALVAWKQDEAKGPPLRTLHW
ncbi:MAG TPA: FHA domain-containing protein, partial [Pirellulales bacterium]|nr:FHA domain-containing protein [Pirellulales bacterium]